MNILSRISSAPALLALSLSFTTVAFPQSEAQQRTVLVQGGDSLLNIAFENRPDLSVSIQQTMLEILQLNPGAFIEGNINRIMAGERLLLPVLDQVRSIDQTDAIQEIRDQNQQFIVYSSSDLLENNQAGQLSVLRPGMESSRIVPGLEPLDRENTELDQRVTELEDLVALALEEDDRYRLRREDLSAQLAELDVQVEAATEIIRLQDLQLTQLRADLAETQFGSINQAIPLSEAVMREEKLPESASYSAQGLLEGLVGVFQSNSPLITIAAPLILLLLGWLLWWDRKNYASANSRSDLFQEAAAEDPSEPSPIDNESELESVVQPDQKINFARDATNFNDGVLANRADVERESADTSSNEENEKLDFLVEGESGDFEDLVFLSDEDRDELDSPGDIEEVFYLGSEESATKLELAYAYQKMGDLEGAKEILSEVIVEGNSEQKIEAEKLLIAIGNARE